MKRSITPNFLRRIRIRGGEFDASARAMHRKAAVGNVPVATIERKIMSTKTTFRRIALVAVAAVGFGMLTGVAANAADTAVYVNLTGTTIGGTQATTSNTTAYPALAATQISGVTATVGQAVSLKISTVDTGTIQTGKSSSTVRFQSDTLGTLGTSAALAANETSTVVAFNAPGLAGTFTGHIIVNNGTTDVSSSAFTVTVSAASPYSSSNSTAILNNLTHAGGTAAISDDTVVVTKSAGAAGEIDVTLRNAAGGVINGETVGASITGSGLISIDTTRSASTLGNARSVTSGVLAGNVAYIHISSDGSAGVGTITINVTDAVSGVTSTLQTKTVTFTGAAATFAATALYTNLKVGANGVDNNSGDAPLGAALAVKVTDANGNIVADGTSVYASSGSTGIATISPLLTTTGGYAYFAVQGIAAGTSTITFGNLSTSPTVTTTAVVTVTGSVISTLTLAFDKASYAPGEKMLLTVTAKDSTGAGVADNAYTIFTAAGLTTNVALQGFPGVSPIVDLVAGVETFTVYAPVSGATVTVSATTSSTSTSLVAALRGVVLTATADVTGDTSATDAANAATDAANYAADAADAATTAAEEATAAAVAAQDSADAATAAVVALGLRVAVLYAATRTQILRLQALLVRLIKKLHA